jgi:hypothetical protein
MDELDKIILKKKEIIINYCENKGYAFTTSNTDKFIRLDISNLANRVNVNIFPTGTIQVQGKESDLRKEIDTLKHKIQQDPSFFENKKILSSSTKYDILLPETRNKIKEALESNEDNIFIEDNPNDYIQYKVNIKRNNLSLTIIHFTLYH